MAITTDQTVPMAMAATTPATPCHHWGARFLADLHRDFGGFVIASSGRTIFHCGDTAYFPGFKEIGDRFSVDLALLPIGAYEAPTGREVHMTALFVSTSMIS